MKLASAILLSLGLCFPVHAQTRTDRQSARLEGTTGQERLAVLVDLMEDRYIEDAGQALAYGREAAALLTAETVPALTRRLWYRMGLAYERAEQYDSVRVTGERLRAWAASVGDARGATEGAYLEGAGLIMKGAYAPGRVAMETALSDYEARNDRAGMGAALRYLGLVHDFQGELDVALTFYQRSLAIREALGNRRDIAQSLKNIGIIHMFQGDNDQALSYYFRSLALYQALGDQVGIANLLGNTGGVYLLQGDYDEALSYFERALALYETLGNHRGMSAPLNNIGNIYQKLGDYDRALSFYTRALAISEELGDRRDIADHLSNIGLNHRNLGDYDQALSFYTRALAIREELGDRRGMASLFNNISLIHQNQGHYDEALSYLSRALAIQEELGDRRGMASSLNNIGNLYYDLGSYDEALTVHNRSLALYTALDSKDGMASSLNNIGNIHKVLGDFDAALAVYTRSLAIKEEIGKKAGISSSLLNLGSLHQKRGVYDEALSFYRRALDLLEELDDKEGIAEASRYIGTVYRLMERPEDALAATGRALALADSIGALPLVRDAYEERTRIFEQQGRFKEALDAHRAYKAAYDSLFTTESQSVIAELQQQYKTRQQQQQIQLLEQDQKIQRLWLFGLLAGLLLLAAIAFLAYNRYRLKNRAHTALTRAHDQLHQTLTRLQTTQQQLVHAEKMASLGQLTAGIAHEIKNPLNFVNNFAEVNEELADELREALANGESVDDLLDDLKQNAQVIAQHGRRADGIVRAMMQHAGSGAGRRESTEINNLVREHIALAYHGKRAQVPELGVQIEQTLGDDVGTLEVVPQDIGRVLLNLLGNAFDAVHEYAAGTNGQYVPTVTVSTRRVGDQVEIRVADNGPGIPAEIREKIFEPFFTTKPTGHGSTGLGLSLSYDIVAQGHGGTLTVESEEGEGATFIVTLPLNRTAAASMA